MTSTNIAQETYEIALLRHGESIGNAQGYYQGQSDFPLTETGIKQTEALCQRWIGEKKKFNLIISSPLSRARQTAEILSRTLDIPLEIDSIWMERDAGKISGLSPEEAEKLVPQPPFSSIYRPIGITGESQWQLFLRAGKALESLLNHPFGSYLVVSHGGLLNMVLYAVLGITPQANFQGVHFHFRNASFALLTYYENTHTWVIDRLNDRQHWLGENNSI